MLILFIYSFVFIAFNPLLTEHRPTKVTKNVKRGENGINLYEHIFRENWKTHADCWLRMEFSSKLNLICFIELIPLFQLLFGVGIVYTSI